MKCIADKGVLGQGELMTSPKKTVETWFNFISESRADGLSWAEIERRLAQKGFPVSNGYLKVLYQKEASRHLAQAELEYALAL